ncbi:hypothetical protein JW926_04535 [Candidatus Sumerlaeota bacterium]|nr:hypothetical protein [Candidatus Sumerlaeota bacterium]
MLLLCSVIIGCATTNTKGETAIPQTLPLHGKIVIRWKKIRSYDSYGYNIMRSETREGPFIRLNRDIILGSLTSKPDIEYKFVDQPLEIGKIYYYYVESVDYAGQKKQMTPLTKVIVKTPVNEPDSPEE